MTQPEGKPMFPIPAVNQWKDESTDGPVKKLQALLEQHWPGLNLLAATYRSMTSKACRCCSQRAVSDTDAAKFPARWPGSRRPGRCEMHQLGLQDLQVLAISSLTCPDEVTLESRANHLARSLSAQVVWKPDLRGVSSAVACRVLRSSPIWCG